MSRDSKFGILLLKESRGFGAFTHQGFGTDVLLVFGGAVTVIPLILFTLGVRRITLSTTGLLQYIAPTCTFLLAVFLYGEPFTAVHAVTFALIWAALAEYSYDLRQRFRTQ